MTRFELKLVVVGKATVSRAYHVHHNKKSHIKTTFFSLVEGQLIESACPEAMGRYKKWRE
jgi:hypothetical protein